MDKFAYLAQVEKEGKDSLQEWYEKQPKKCTCRAILRQAGTLLNRDMVLTPERKTSQGCPHHCNHEGIKNGKCWCGKLI